MRHKKNILLLFALAVLGVGSPQQDAVAQEKTAANALETLSKHMSPAGRKALGAAYGQLKPAGYELATTFLKPLAEGNGPLAASLVARKTADARQQDQKIKQLMHNQVELLGGYGVQDIGQPINWFYAPKSDYQWSTHLSRHYWLAPLAYAYRATGQKDYAAKIVSVLLDWVARNPMGSPELHNYTDGFGRRYAQGQPAPVTAEGHFKGYVDGPWTALSAHARVDYWTELLQLIWDAPALNNQAVAVLLNSLMGDHRQLMIDFPRQMNQYQAIASSLVRLGFYYPGFNGVAAAEKAGWERLVNHTTREIYPDGSLAECSPNYGLGMVKRLQDIIEEGEKRKRQIPSVLRERVSLACRYYAFTASPLGGSPRIAKGGGAVLADLAILTQVAPDPEVGYIVSKSQSGRKPRQTSVSFPWAGHHVLRSGWDPAATWLFFDAGPRGTGHHDIAQLSVQLMANGQWLLTDPGFFSYGGDAEANAMIHYLHSTAAHNTALVDGQGQMSRPEGKAAEPNTQAGHYGWTEKKGKVTVQGLYGYGYGNKEKPIPVQHHRKITYDPAKAEFLVEDRFEGEGHHRVAIHWQLAPGVNFRTGSKEVLVEQEKASLRLLCISKSPLHITSSVGSKAPLAGWYSQGYGKLSPAPVVQVSTEGKLPLTVKTRLIVSATNNQGLKQGR
jgi:hypothetical protein